MVSMGARQEGKTGTHGLDATTSVSLALARTSLISFDHSPRKDRHHFDHINIYVAWHSLYIEQQFLSHHLL
jgi:hypothetical protein